MINKTANITMVKSDIKDIIKADYNRVIYDGCPNFEDFDPDIENRLWFILQQNSKTAGLIMMEKINYHLWMPHIVILKEYRGNGSEEWGRMVVNHMKNIFKNITLLDITPYRITREYALKVGFKDLTILKNSLKKNGQLMDQYLLVLEDSKGEKL